MATEAKSEMKRGVAKIARGSELAVSESLYQKALRQLRRDRLSMTMLGVLVVLVIFSLSAPLIESVFEVSYRRTDTTNAFQPILSEGHILGTDDLGRDHLARLARAGQITLGIAFAAAILSLTIGLTVGVSTGYYGGIVDDIIMWVISTINSIPQLILLVILAAVLRPGPTTLILVLGLLGWTGTTRLVRGETLSLREREYVVSAKAMGASDIRIMATHIAPNLISILVVTLAIDIGSLMLAEAALSFLGLGVQPPTPTWGNMLTGAQDIIKTAGARHLAIIPGVLITLTVLCFYVLGDGIRDAFDPTLDK
jgi:peptide/nickel transport system permease protein